MPYNLEGPKWGPPTRGTTAVITWSFADLDLTGALRQTYSNYPVLTGAITATFRDIVRSAFGLWTAVSGLTFVETADAVSNDIRLGEATIDGSGPNLGFAQYYSSGGVFRKAAIDFDIDAFDSPQRFYFIALHEIGHAIGLDHSTSPTDVMFAYLGLQNQSGLSIDDMAGARALYATGLTLTGSAASELLLGGSGDDLIFGKEGGDTINAGTGNNIIVGGLDSTDGADLVTAGAGYDLIYGNGGDDTISSVGGKDITVGGFGSDHITLGSGNDIVYGNQQNDTIDAGDGNNLIFGGLGDDVIQTGAGADVIWGNEGDDLLIGGGGADRFVFATGSGADQIVGFNVGDGDRLDLLGQNYALSSAANGDAVLLLSGGGSIQLLGLAASNYSGTSIA